MAKTKVNPIPHGMRTVTPHLICAGAADAIEFYKKAVTAQVRTRSRLPG
jgi:PhnB protein